MLYVVDTHYLVYYLLNKLPPSLEPVFKSVERGDSVAVLPTITLIELIHLSEKERIDLDAKSVLSDIAAAQNFIPFPLNFEVAAKVPNLIKLRDFHDRIVVATALLLNAKLLSKDSKIIDSGYIEVIS